MNYRFSEAMAGISPSAIREILKYSTDPEVVPFSAGNPAPEAFPVSRIAAISARIFQENPITALQYGATEGYQPLRDYLKQYLKTKHAIGLDGDDLIITSGAQQVMELAAKSLCNAGDVIITEDPSFIGSLNSFRSLGAKLVGVPVQPDGMDLEALESALKAHPNAKLIYTIPNFQNPTGVTMSWKKRQGLYALAKQYGVLIVEDNPYGDLRFAGEEIPAIKTLDTDGLVIYAGSFSKVLAPGMRVAYACGPDPVIRKMTVAKQGEDVHTGLWQQMVAYEFMQEGFEEHLQSLRAIYRGKAERMMALCEEYLVPHGITYLPIEGGLFLWATLPEGADMPRFCTEAVRDHKVAFVPGSAFLTDPTAPCQSFRLNFSTPTDEAMLRGMEKLGAFASKFLK
ncbi:MAG: PLP-dependent aminotransferase family protein [Clostridia bacterium]|nr:PLP-dependent aminotransferase family protein [Clostridia bacterium]